MPIFKTKLFQLTERMPLAILQKVEYFVLSLPHVLRGSCYDTEQVRIFDSIHTHDFPLYTHHLEDHLHCPLP